MGHHCRLHRATKMRLLACLLLPALTLTLSPKPRPTPTTSTAVSTADIAATSAIPTGPTGVTTAAEPAADPEADPWYLYSGYYGYARPYGYGYYGYRPYYGGYYGYYGR